MSWMRMDDVSLVRFCSGSGGDRRMILPSSSMASMGIGVSAVAALLIVGVSSSLFCMS